MTNPDLELEHDLDHALLNGGVTDSQASPEARAAIAAAALVVPTWGLTPEECSHSADAVEIGRGFTEDRHTMTVHRCPECGTQLITEKTL